MHGHYKKIETSIDETTYIALYVVYYEAVRGDGITCGSAYKPIGVYENEDTAKAVVNAIEGGLI